MLSTCKGWDTQTSRKLGLIFCNWGVICLICLEMLWQCVERGFCMTSETGWGERGSVCPTTWRTMSMNVWRSIVLPERQPVSCLKIDLQYNLKRVFKLFGVLMASEGDLITAG